MITSSTYRDCVTVFVTHPSDREVVERTAAAALRHGSRVSIMAETQGKRGLICNARPVSGNYFVSSEKGSAEHPTIAAALTAGLRHFDAAFDDLDVWSRSRRDND